jgi:phage baseplate assembly protein W
VSSYANDIRSTVMFRILFWEPRLAVSKNTTAAAHAEWRLLTILPASRADSCDRQHAIASQLPDKRKAGS